jgi:hypothetical protein
MFRKIIKLVFQRMLPIYIPGECKPLVLAIWSAPTEPATIGQRWASLRITLRSHSKTRERILWVLKKGTV